MEIQTISKSLPKTSKGRTLSLFHMNLCSLTKNFDDFNRLLNELIVNFNILPIKESHINKDLSSTINLQLNNYSTEHTKTESAAGGTSSHIGKRLSYLLRNEQKLSHPGKIESTFVKIICSKPTNLIVGCKYKNPTKNRFSDFFFSIIIITKTETSKRISS